MERYPINFQWNFSSNFSQNHFSGKGNFEKQVDIPHTNTIVPYNNFNERISQGICVYQKIIEIKKTWNKKIVRLYFEGIAHKASVYCNGNLVTEHHCGYTPFVADCTEYIEYGKNNTITVIVDSRESLRQPPFGNVIDYLVYGGIYREVFLEVIDKEHIVDTFLYCNNPLDEEKKLEAEITTHCNAGSILNVEIWDENILLGSNTSNAKSSLTHINIVLLNIKLWSPNGPKRYKVVVTLTGSLNTTDIRTFFFGFREAIFKKDGFFLNGKRYKLIGLNRHQIFPFAGYAMPKSAQVRDAEIFKHELAINCVRTAHYPHSRHFIEACDALGIMVFEEIPGWQYVSANNEWREQHLKNIHDMIIRDRNYACIILWGVRINESIDDKELYTKSNKIARELDPIRQTGGVRCFAHSQFLEDVYTYNDFIYNGKNIILQDPKNITQKSNAPYLITESMGHMFPTKSFDSETKRLEHAIRHAKIINETYTHDRISGVFGWISFDYNTHEDFGSGDRICYHGVMDMFRIPKLAAAVYASQGDKIFLEVSSNFNIGEHPDSRIQDIYVFTNCDSIEVYRNKDIIDTFYPAYDVYPHLKHPPIILDDLFGNILTDKEGLSKEEADEIKLIYHTIKKYGFENFTEEYKQSVGIEKVELANKMYGKYIANWGAKHVEYTFKGFKNSELVKTVVKSVASKFYFDIIADTYTLYIGDTYDTVWNGKAF